MNLRGGWALVKSSWTSWMQYRSFFFVLAFGWMVPPLVSLFAWSAAAGGGQVGSFSRGGFVAYYLVLVLVNQFTYAQANWTLGDMIRIGQLNSWLLRPMPPLYNVLASEVAGKVVTMLFVLPVAGLLALLLRPEMNPSPQQVGLFFLSLILAWGLRFLWGCWLAMLAFWATRADALLALQDSLVFLFSGVVAPVALLPGGIQTLARVLPFRSMVGLPVEILTQALSPAEICTGLGIQAAWLLVAGGLAFGVWRAGLRRYAAVGG